MPANVTGYFVPTTDVWDVTPVYSVDVGSPEFKDLLVRMYQNLNNMSLAINARDTGYYDTREFLNGQLFPPNPVLNSSSSVTPTYRAVTRKLVLFGALPNTGAKSVPHMIDFTGAATTTRIYGSSTDPVSTAFIPLPYASPTLANNISVDVDATNVTIVTGSNRTAFTVTYIIIEYLQS